MSSTTANARTSTSKNSKKSRIVILRLSPDKLSAFATPPPAIIKPDPSPSVHPPDSTDKTSESNATPLPSHGEDAADGNSLAPPPKVDRRRRGGGTVSGRKRAPPAIDPNAPMRERARPGPKKRARTDNPTDPTTNTTAAPGNNNTTNPAPAHRLGPKANTGAINAGLRALDRSGKPCRRWERKGLQIKSFTGTMWGLPTWKAPARDTSFPGDVKSDSTGSSGIEQEEGLNGSSRLMSERSHSGGDVAMESSPVPPMTAVGVGV